MVSCIVKVKETEILSLKQQQKVDELEAQLEEAEDIVGELRAELRLLQDELKKLTDGQTHLISDHEEHPCLKNRDAAVSVVPEVSCSHENTEAVASCIPVEQSESVVANGIKVPSLARINSINRCSYQNNKDQCDHSLPSILTKRKEADGSAQIIHAVDSSMANGDLSSSVEVGDVNDGGCLHKVSSCKSVETLEMSGCAADATTESISSVRNGESPVVSPNAPQKDDGTPVFLKTSPLTIGKTDAKKEEKESCENMEVSASPFCEETPVLAVSKNRCIKYTFQRKRKKEVLSNLQGTSSFEESRNVKQKTGEKDVYLESLKPSFTSESSRDVVYA
ncbi:PREDICTED: uncharacterized protein LOC104713124 isoform X2 [Camelina sativa]|uniref:Uncharacterized protein LOC104713124 isoform X2 n=1 Tax=Camelina sativa TaxID=90675 RepID=A0ABM0TMC3_CAMSA|nr:PREDICTED: uncharacterized protein LOC104713124 isoform X2 [Camelina sativa]